MGQLLKLFKLLNADVSPTQIAAGIAMGMVLGFTPLFSLHNILTLFLICLLRINISAVLVSMVVCSGLAYLLDSVFLNIGEGLLHNESLNGTWTAMYQSEIWRLAHFNHTLVLGSVVFSILAFLPCLLISRFIIVKYRERILAWVMKTHLVKAIKASKWFNLAQDAVDLTNAVK
ncbi:TIGR03546 family protein [Agaribacterium sp. ZY112]|uniref:TIGR03546 family protein n=1 Tax=Agaribacterium sp. ZY112 TaxID=3233574 RepID=UPI003523B671